jgi:hypothetical protein
MMERNLWFTSDEPLFTITRHRTKQWTAAILKIDSVMLLILLTHPLYVNLPLDTHHIFLPTQHKHMTKRDEKTKLVLCGINIHFVNSF